jgi:hypothetical protein
MAENADVLELLRSRLADLETRQRSSGSTSASDFWQRLTRGMPSGPSVPDAESAGAAGKRRRRSRRLAPESRPLWSGHGPWAEVPAERLASLDPRALLPLDEAR